MPKFAVAFTMIVAAIGLNSATWSQDIDHGKFEYQQGMAIVEEKMGELPRNKVDAVRDAMAQARAANAANNYKACEKALADVRHIMAH